VAVAGCSSSTEPDDADLGDGLDGGVFAALPLTLANIKCIHALGEINTPGQALGAHQARWDVVELGACGALASPPAATPIVVSAVASGTIVAIATTGIGSVMIAINDDLEYTYRNVVLDGFFRSGTVVQAGQRLGLIGNRDSGLVFGVTDFTQVNDWLSPARYPDAYRHARHPLGYFSDARQQTLRILGVIPADPTGRLMWDVTGTLAGNWFREGTPRTAAAVTAEWWDGHLAFHGDSSRQRVGAGAALGLNGCRCAPRAGERRFDLVDASSGPVAYHLARVDANGTVANTIAGTLLIEMIASDQIRAQLFAGDVASPVFTDAALTYIR